MKETRPEYISKSYSCAGKVFLLGEYTVLNSGSGLLAAVAPRFSLSTHQGEVSVENKFTIGSPAQRLCQNLRASGRLKDEIFVEFDDPHRGEGGFGASTAQYILTAAALDLNMAISSLWARYRKNTTSSQGTIPSGADLVCQMLGGFVFFDGSDPSQSTSLNARISGDHILVFSATGQEGRKTPTHIHLEDLMTKGFPEQYSDMLRELDQGVELGRKAIEGGDLPGFGKALENYGDILAKNALEVEATREDRQAIRSLSGVLGVKGSGALQSDAVIVLVENPDSDDTERVVQLAKERGLKCVARGLQLEKGWTQQ